MNNLTMFLLGLFEVLILFSGILIARFKFKAKGFLYYIVLGIAVICFAVSLYSSQIQFVWLPVSIYGVQTSIILSNLFIFSFFLEGLIVTYGAWFGKLNEFPSLVVKFKIVGPIIMLGTLLFCFPVLF